MQKQRSFIRDVNAVWFGRVHFRVFLQSANLILGTFLKVSYIQNARTRFLRSLSEFTTFYYLQLEIKTIRNSDQGFILSITYVIIYLIICFIASFLLFLLTYLLLIPFIRRSFQYNTQKIAHILSGDITNYDLGKKLIEWCLKMNQNLCQFALTFIMKTYVSFIFHTQINIGCNKYNIAAILIFLSSHRYTRKS